jgi:hypothetical protein
VPLEQESEMDDFEESTDEDAIVLRAVEVLSEIDGDDELAHAQREVLAAVAQEAMALKKRRQERERQQRRDELYARREAERSRAAQRAREEAERVEAVRRARAAQAARVEAERRARARDEALRHEQARRARERTVPPAPRPEKPAVLVVSGSISPLDPAGLPELPPLTGADLTAWRVRAGLTQQAAAEQLGIRQGTVSKAESRGLAVLGPALQQALARALGVARTK